MNQNIDYYLKGYRYFNVGVDEEYFDIVYRRQRKSNWCLPATFETIARYYGHNIYQEQIVAKNCGVLSDGSPKNCSTQWYIFNEIASSCNEQYCVDVDFHVGFPYEEWLVEELSQQRPVILEHLLPGAVVGHALIATGAEGYIFGKKVHITKLRFRDPAQYPPYGRGETVNMEFFKRHVRAHWYVKITMNESQYVYLTMIA